MADESFIAGVVLAGAVGVAGGVLSPVVVARRWGFAAEGIAHAGFAGAGTAWMLAAGGAIAATSPTVLAGHVFLSCVLAALAIAALARRGRGVVGGADVATGAVLTATLAWGFVGREVFVRTYETAAPGFDQLTLGRFETTTWATAAAATLAAGGLVAGLWLLRGPVVAYAAEPRLARAAGVPEQAVHLGLMLTLGVVVALAVRVVGSLLVTAVLVLPGAVAARWAVTPTRAAGLAVLLGGGACVTGTLAARQVNWLPAGPAIVFALLVCYAGSLWRRA